jgi:hypothetical protein
MITGNDETSIEVLDDFCHGKTLSYIIHKYDISVEQAKQLSRLHLIYQQLELLPQSLQTKLKALGLKVIVLSPLIKANDIDGVQDILQSVDTDIKRDALMRMIPDLNEKRMFLKEAQNKIEYKKNDSKHTEERME